MRPRSRTSETRAGPVTDMEPLTVPGTLDAWSAVGRYVLDAASAAGLDKKAAYRLRLAVDEIVTNIILHGYQEAGRTSDVSIRAQMDPDVLTITLEDTALPFDPRNLPRPKQIDLPLEERPVGGLGIFLAMENVDQFKYEYVGNRNRNILIMNRPQEL
jgi:serine/threonine-protein kinase RsbW